ncbi:alpha/beta hydrolase, partial [Streptomyces sp. NPDC057654]|uniref:alpha/beta hydrolase n=1 Tax=Streptomyces sp. NPDC057654 TaxID=3346196 RepID=UPI00367A2D90
MRSPRGTRPRTPYRQRRRRARTLAATALAVALAATACSGDGGDGKAAGDKKPGSASQSAPTGGSSAGAQKLSWHGCTAPTTAQGGSGKAPAALADGTRWECSTLKVPLDYAKPSGDTIDLALIRAKARGGADRIGSLVFNFGGPGGSGVATLPGFARDYEALRARYDLVSFDPRGVGASAGVRCLSDKEIDDSDKVDSTPDDDDELKTALAANKAYVDACRKNSGKVLGHVDTTSAARDLDVLRQALGDDKLHYFGISYGTELGGVYAHLFPKRVGHAVLDAVVDPTQDPLQGDLNQAKGFQRALEDYMRDCAENTTGCPTGNGSPEEGTKRITALLKKLDSEPLPTRDGRELTQDQAVNGIASALYSKETWQYLTRGLQEAMTLGSGNYLQLLSDSLSGRDQNGRYSNLQAANRAITCADAQQRYDANDVQAWLARFRQASPVFGESSAWSLLNCAGWPVEGRWKTPDVRAAGAAPVLVVGNTGDPATPYEGARRMARELGEGVGVEVTFKGEGHGAYNSGNGCMTRTVNGYLLGSK